MSYKEQAVAMLGQIGSTEYSGLILALLAIVDVLEDIRDDERNRAKSQWLDTQ